MEKIHSISMMFPSQHHTQNQTGSRTGRKTQKSEDKIQKILIKNLKQENQDALDELIDTKGKLNEERAKVEELTKENEQLKAKIKEEKKQLEFELQFSLM